MAIQYAPLFALETQFQTKDGRNNTGGWLKVFLAATDDPATTYSDYNGTRNPDKIVLDDDGRALVICDKSKAYRLEVYSMDGTLLWTEEPVYCSGTGGGGVSITKVVSTDGSISVDKNVAGSTTTYDLGIAHSSDEFLEWIKCSENDCGATWYPVFQDGTMETEAGQGVKVHKGHLYHFTNSFTVDPDGTGVNYDTFRVSMYCGDEEVEMREFDIDSSLNDPVLCEFSRDVVPPEDTHVYFKLTIPATCKASGEVQCHRIYSGINAVPDTCATKQWVSGSFQPLSGMSAYVHYSSIDNNSMGQVTGINGSAIAGGLDSASVSSIASSVASAYTESAFSSLSSKADSSALTAYQPVSAMGAYATTAYVDGMVSGKLDTSAFNSSDFYPTSNPSGFITGVDLGDYATTGYVDSSVSGKLDTTAFNSGDFYPTSNPSGYITGVDLTPYQEKSAMTAYQPSGNYYSASNPSGFITGVDLGGYATTGFVESAVSGKLDTTAFNPGDFYTTANESGFVGKAYVDSSVSGKLDTTAFASASAGFQPTGDYAYNSSLTSYIPASASGAFQPSGDYQTAGDYAFNSAVSSKLDASASGDFVMNSAMTSWIPYSALGYSGTAISGIGGSSLAGMGGGDYTGIYPVNVDNDTREIAVDSMPLVTDSSMTAYASAGSSVIGVNLDIMSSKQDTLAFAYNTANQISSINGSALGGMDEAAVSGIASSYAQSAASGKLDTSAFNSGDFYSTANPSGFITGVDLTPYQEKSAMTAYQPSGDYYSASNPSGFITLSDVPAQVNADWNAVSGVAEILNKPAIPSGTQLVPAATSADADKVLTVNAQGTPEWATGSGSQVQADWTESDSSKLSYIENKPVPKTLKAGMGISITENASRITVSSTVTVPVRDVTVDGSSVVSNGVAAITTPTVDQTYDASSTNAQSGVAVASGISAAIAEAVIPISVVESLPANPDPNTLYVVTGA